MGRKKFYANAISIIAISAFVVGVFLITQSFYYGGIFLEKRENSRARLVAQAEKSIQELTMTVSQAASATLAGQQDSSRHMQQLHNELQRMAEAIANVADRDRSDSLDIVFEKFSMLMAIAALIFGGFGIFTGLQYRQFLVKARNELRNERQEFKKESSKIVSDIENRSADFQKSLYDAIDRSMDMIWIFGNSLEQFINIGVVSSKSANQFLKDLYKIGFRFELRSVDENERMSAIQNLWAQGDCEDLAELNNIRQSKDEPKEMRELAWLAIKNILKRCKHDNGHSDLFGNSDH